MDKSCNWRWIFGLRGNEKFPRIPPFPRFPRNWLGLWQSILCRFWRIVLVDSNFPVIGIKCFINTNKRWKSMHPSMHACILYTFKKLLNSCIFITSPSFRSRIFAIELNKLFQELETIFWYRSTEKRCGWIYEKTNVYVNCIEVYRSSQVW